MILKRLLFENVDIKILLFDYVIENVTTKNCYRNNLILNVLLLQKITMKNIDIDNIGITKINNSASVSIFSPH